MAQTYFNELEGMNIAVEATEILFEVVLHFIAEGVDEARVVNHLVFFFYTNCLLFGKLPPARNALKVNKNNN